MAKSGWTFQDNTIQAQQTLVTGVRAAVEETAYDVVEAAQSKCPVDTGALRASIHPVFTHSSGYGAAVGAARVLGKEKVQGKIAPPMGVLPETHGEIPAAVDVAATYGTFLEHGAFNVRANRQMPAQPFLLPGLVSCKSKFERRLKSALNFKAPRGPKAPPTEEQQQQAYERYMAKGAASEARQWKAAQSEGLREANSGMMKRTAYGANRTRTGKRYRESFGEMWERMRQEYEHKRNFD